MAKISSLLLLFLAIAAASIDAPAAAAVSNAALQKATAFLDKWHKRIEKASDIFDAMDELLPASGGGGGENTAGLTAPVAVTVVEAGGMNFSVTGIDVTSPVTWTSQCGAGADSRVVPCDDPLCKQYGARQQPKCGGSGAAQLCSSSSSAVLQKGNITLFTNRQFFSTDDTAYACRPAGSASGSGDYAVIGLSRDSLLASNSPRLFSYILDSDLRSTVWLSTEVWKIQATARAGSTTIIGIGSLPYYAVSITGIKVGDDGNVKKNNTVGFLTTTLPFTLLNPALFDHLKRELSSVASPVNGSSDLDARYDQLCYSNKTKLPAISLFFVPGDDRVMKVNQEQYSYSQSNGVVCLSILRSPLKNGVSVIGSMLQAGRWMTYDLDKNTLTFGDATLPLQASSSPSAPIPILLCFAWVLVMIAI